MVDGFLPVLLLGLLGGAIAEAIKVAGAFRAGSPPTSQEWIASAIIAALGAGAVLYGWDVERIPIEVATLGAAFPSLFTAATRAATGGEKKDERLRGNDFRGGRGLTDWLSGRY